MSQEGLKQYAGLFPKHIGIIMDGNGRWAQKRGLPRTMGHRAGVKAFSEAVKNCSELGIAYLTFYAFSTENWKRPQAEVDALMALLREYLSEAERSQENRGRVCFLGDPSPLDSQLQERMRALADRTKNNQGITVNIALNYGGRAEIARAARLIAREVLEGKLAPDSIGEETISDHLYTAGQPDPDLIIRPSGELRLSNFLIWQAAYCEYVFMDVLWPDFGRKELENAILQYVKRNRRFGGLGE